MKRMKNDLFCTLKFSCVKNTSFLRVLYAIRNNQEVTNIILVNRFLEISSSEQNVREILTKML